MRYAMIPECAFESANALGEYTGQKAIMTLLSSAFDNDFDVEEVDKSILPVYLALHEGIDTSVFSDDDDDDDFRPCEHKMGIAHVEMIPHLMDREVIEHFIHDIESAIGDDGEDDED